MRIKTIRANDRECRRERRSANLEPCPFCGTPCHLAQEAVYTSGGRLGGLDYAVRCMSCDALGPWGASGATAILLWNERKAARPKNTGTVINRDRRRLPAKILAACALAIFCLVQPSLAITADDPVSTPLFLQTESNICSWVASTIQAAPPAGGTVTVLRHWPPHHVKNDRVGEIWIVSSVVKLVIDGKTQYVAAFCVYHVETQQSELKLAFAIGEDHLQEWLKPSPSQTSVLVMPDHPPRV